MPGLGTIINTAAVILGGFLGLFFGGLLKENHQDGLSRACGVTVLFLGIAGAMEGMLHLEEGSIVSGRSMFIILSVVIGALFGELINLEGRLETFGEWLKAKTGNAKDARFVEAFVTATLTICIGAMAVVGSIQDGIRADHSILFAKSVLDLIIIMVMTSSMGKGCIFSAIPILVFQGGITLLARLIEPIMTPAALTNLSLVGSILIFCVGVNLVWGKQIRVANLLPAVVVAVIFAYLPAGFIG